MSGESRKLGGTGQCASLDTMARRVHQRASTVSIVHGAVSVQQQDIKHSHYSSARRLFVSHSTRGATYTTHADSLTDSVVARCCIRTIQY